jgi:hypothetical protein
MKQLISLHRFVLIPQGTVRTRNLTITEVKEKGEKGSLKQLINLHSSVLNTRYGIVPRRLFIPALQ